MLFRSGLLGAREYDRMLVLAVEEVGLAVHPAILLDEVLAHEGGRVRVYRAHEYNDEGLELILINQDILEVLLDMLPSLILLGGIAHLVLESPQEVVGV